MSARYLNLPEPTYIPKYQPIDNNMLMGTANNINQQAEQGWAEHDRFNAVIDTVGNQISSLSEADRMKFTEMANQSRQALDNDFEKYGARQMRYKAGSQARQFAQQTQPYLNVVNRVSELQKVISDSKAGGPEKDIARRQIQEAIQNGVENFQAPNLSVYENWKDLNKDIDDFAKNWKMDESFVQNVVNTPEGREIHQMIRGTASRQPFMTATGNPISGFQEAAIMRLYNDPQSREQLKIQAQANGIDINALSGGEYQEALLTEAQRVVDPQAANLRAETIKNHQVIKDEANVYENQYNPTLKIGVQGVPEYQSVGGILQEKKGLEAFFKNQENEIKSELAQLSVLYPEYANYEVYENKDNDLSIRDRDTGDDVPRANVSSITYHNTVRKAQREQRKAYTNILDGVVREVFDNQYSSFEELQKTEEFQQVLSIAERRVRGGRSAMRRDPLTSLFASRRTDPDFEENLEAQIGDKARQMSNQIAVLDEKLKEKFGTTEIDIRPSNFPTGVKRGLEDAWNITRAGSALFDKEGNELTIDSDLQFPQKADAVGYVVTGDGFEIVWAPKDAKENEYNGLIRTRANDSQITTILKSNPTFGRDIIYSHIQKAQDSQNISNSSTIKLDNNRQLDIYYSRESGKYTLNFSPEWEQYDPTFFEQTDGILGNLDSQRAVTFISNVLRTQ